MRIVTSALAIALLFAAQTPLAAQATATITGSVTASESGAPLAGAQVSLQGTVRRTVTDAQGRFRLNVEPGGYTVLVSALGSQPMSRQVSAVVGRTTVVNMSLPTLGIPIEGAVKSSPVAHASPRGTSDIVRAALDDAEPLVGTPEAGNAVAQIHAALHGHLIAVGEAAGIEYPDAANLTEVFTVLIQQHPALQDTGLRSQDITMVLMSTAAMLDSFRPIPNTASLAHPDPVLEAPETFLMINAARTLFDYLDRKLR